MSVISQIKSGMLIAAIKGGHCTRLCLKCDGTRTETRFRLSVKQASPFKSAGASVQSTTGRPAVHISLQSLYCSCKPVFCSHVMLTGYPLHSLVSPSLLLPCVTVCHHISTGLYYISLALWITVTNSCHRERVRGEGGREGRREGGGERESNIKYSNILGWDVL